MAWEESIKNVYVICNQVHEPERYNRVIPHIIMSGIPKEKVIVASSTWGDTLTEETIFNVYNPFIIREKMPTFSFKAACLSRGEISLNMNFYNIVLNSLNDLSGNDSILVLESDVYLRKDFTERLSNIIKDLSGQEWDYVSLGEGVGTRPPDAPFSYYGPTKLYSPPYSWAFRCTDSMLLNRRFLEKLKGTFIPFKECLDWEMNFQLILHKGVALWADPPLVEPGSTHFRDASKLL